MGMLLSLRPRGMLTAQPTARIPPDPVPKMNPRPSRGITLTHEHEDAARGRNGRTRRSEVQVLRILVVEDEPDIGIALRSGLAADGNAVDVVGDGRAALDWAETYPYELIVLDIVLPGTDGREGPRIPGDSLADADSPGIHHPGRRWPR